MHRLTYGDIESAGRRIAGRVRPVALAPADPDAADPAGQPCELWLALEFMQHTGSFKARGALNFLQAHLDAGSLPDAGVTIASGGNAGLACAWAARRQGVRATVFLPANAPAVKVARLRGYGAEVRLVGDEYAEAASACAEFAATTGALASHAYDHPLIAAGAGTLLDEIRHRIPDLDTVVVAVGGGGLFAGVATAAREHGIRTVAVEPEHSRALAAALAAGRPVDVPIDSVAADSLGARRASALALQAAQGGDVHSVFVPDSEIVRARQGLWDERRIAVEHGGATALAAMTAGEADSDRYGYRPGEGEKVCVVLCGANTDPATLAGLAG
ncbi:serine/threonine dehydratase [Streptomyces mobaraensis NBRC 13819 = DSM 40847]|uniref:Threonine dehydratase n=1 Tax=Streptomyces mobaraensis (strain ATCC 29032 / DSM 40847 / JCM 4168 / NBRC 13819 / NCIMB 11159 / IPCR 16-22) TaxID=1223523 RepID=M3A5Z7_STRM1|nr:serine/threonine dehydratase [Streptomyces mobaraensis]EMF00534.1 threonine dehydratase [Streptomyces mobaraensis NBRC 13819 = DSM 40847]QTT73907.1 serine/threonine dehydratase [Streptomyces mobaraensis NBRC 13819 = DSM 40847]